MGTAYYCTGEQWLSGKCDARGDIYSLGMTLDEWLTGSQRAILVGGGLENAAPVDWTPGARELNTILKKMTQRRAADRPATMAVVAQALRSVSAYA
jgi:hypothetical protein